MKQHSATIVTVASVLLAGLSLALFQSSTLVQAQTATATPQVTSRPLKPAAITATARAQIAQATREAKNQTATAIAQARLETIVMLSEYLPVNLKELLNYSDNHVGEKVFIAGRVFNIVPGDSDAFQIFPTGSTDGVMVSTADTLSDLYEDDVVTIYGVIADEYCFDNSEGNQVCQPHLTNSFFYKKQIPEMRPARATAQAVVVKATQEARTAQASADAQQRATVQARVAEYKPIAMRELLTYPNNHIGEKVRTTGTVFNVMGSAGIVQMYASGTYDAIYVKMEAAFDNLYEDDRITVYGTVGGYECFTNMSGGEVCHPLIEESFYTK